MSAILPAGPAGALAEGAVRVTCRTARGAVLHLAAPAGTSLMALLRDAGAGVEGACGGHLACATCHVVVAADWTARLPAPGEDELAMLDCVDGLTSGSRLSCQVLLRPELDGLAVAIA